MHKESYLDSIDLSGLCHDDIEDIDIPGLALLVLDMQDFFISPGSHAFVPSSPALIPVIQGLVHSFEEQALPVIYTRHLNTASDADMMGRWWRDVITAGNPLSEIHNGFDISNSRVIEKSQYDAFYRTALGDLLEELGVTTVVITGLMTNLCCETTARSAFVRGYRVFMPVDGTATMNSELHRATTVNLAHGFADPVSVSAILASIRSLNGR